MTPAPCASGGSSNLWALDELRGIALRGETLMIGALTTHAELAALVAGACAAADARRLRRARSAARRCSNRGTLGGNLANGSPAGDTLPVLAVAEATVVLASLDGQRRVPFLEFYTGYRRTVMRKDELLLAIEVPPVPGRQWFRKVGTRAAQAISKVVMAAVRADSGFRVAFGSVAPTVVRCLRTEAALAISLAAAQQALRDEIHPIDDLRSTAEYRLRIAGNLLGRFLAETA